ncbi:MAG: nuclear transport factor 2 family protein [Pseudolabrys sp.]
MMRSLLKNNVTLALSSLALLSHFVDASAEPKDEVAAATSTWARALGEDDPDKVLPLYADDAVLWGTLSPTVRSDRSTVRDYFVAAFKVLPGLKVAFGDQLIRVYDCGTAVNTGYYTFSYVKRWRDQELTCPLQLHLRKARRCVANCRSPFISHSIGGEIAL